MSGRWWNQSKVDQLVSFLKENKGLTAMQISKKMGTSRNSVIGKIHRLGMQHYLAGNAEAYAKTQKRMNDLERKKRGRIPPVQKLKLKLAPGAPEPARDASGAFLTTSTVGFRQCRFPYGDAPKLHFCGALTTDSTGSWCQFH